MKRGVTELVTPGVSFNDNVLERKQNNFRRQYMPVKQLRVFLFLDISTGEFYAAQGPEIYINKLIQSFGPAEIIYSKTQREKFETQFGDDYATFTLDDWVYAFDFANDKLVQQFKTNTLKGFGIDGMNEAIIAAGSAALPGSN